MSEPITDAQPDASPEETPGTEPDQQFDADRAKEKIKKANQEAASLRARLKEIEPLAAKAKELEDAGRSELEKLTARAETAERERGELTTKAMRLEVAFEKGLTPAQAKRLVGANREELEADAEEILRDFPVKADGRPRGNADLGPRPSAPPANPQQADLMQIEADLRASQRKK